MKLYSEAVIAIILVVFVALKITVGKLTEEDKQTIPIREVNGYSYVGDYDKASVSNVEECIEYKNELYCR
jgi:hypothetical protein